MIDLNQWKLTLPVGEKGKPAEITPPALLTYESEWLRRVADGLLLTAICGGVSTGGSKYSRTEFRELTKNGDLAAWSTQRGVHEMIFALAVLQLPSGEKPHSVFGQIHGGDDDVTTYRFVGNNDGETAAIWITNFDNSRAFLVKPDYVIGQEITLGFHVRDSIIRYTLNGEIASHTLSAKQDECYFKVGAYPQTTEAGPNGAPNVARVRLQAVTVRHDEKEIDPPTTDWERKVAELAATVERHGALFAALRAALGGK
jgi:hypothetical protein